MFFVTRPKSPETLRDPLAEREAARYEHPIPSRMALLEWLRKQGQVLKGEHIAEGLGLIEDRDRQALDKRLAAMVRDGQLLLNRRGGFAVVAKLDLKRGTVIGHADGFGFCKPDEGGDDLFLPPKEMKAVLHGDRVLVALHSVDARGRQVGTIVEVLERANNSLVGRFMVDRGLSLVVPDHKRIHHEVLIPPGAEGQAKNGDRVVVNITAHPERHRQPVGEVVEVLGDRLSPALAIELSVRAANLPSAWPDGALADAEAVPDRVTDAEIQGREDLRDLELVTIDGEDARDFDDAVYCEPRRQGWRLVVAIADVSHYVQVDTDLDVEARMRSTSAYFPGRVIPMLPERLSNGICSLNPDVERLVMVCDMSVNLEGKVTRSRFYPAVMRSHARLTYNRVWSLLSGDAQPTGAERGWLKPRLNALHALYQALARARRERGALDFDSREYKFQFAADGSIGDVIVVERNPAHLIIEECMIAANVEAAKHLLKHKMPAPFRVHEAPTSSRLDDLAKFLADLGLVLHRDESQPISPLDFADLITRIQERPDRAVIQTVLLRSQNLAVYQCKNAGHFGLALSAYAHFTSPIRRYPDLMVHRAIRHVFNGGTRADFEFDGEAVEQIAQGASAADRRAEEASRDAIERLKCLHLARRIGDQMDGMIAGVTSFGLFVELLETGASGLIHVTQLPNDYYHFDAMRHRLVGERGKRVFQLGQAVKVRVLAVDPEERKIDLKLSGRERERA